MNQKIIIKFSKSEESFINSFHKHKHIVFFIIITILALLIRNDLRYFESGDYVIALLPWTEYLEQNGGLAGIPTLESSYSVAYLYILALLTYLPASILAKIKMVSVVFDFVTAGFILLIIRKLFNLDRKSLIPILAFGITLFAPTVILNSAVWGQCDIIYSSFIIISIYLILNKKFSWAFVSYGMALAFKLQAIFVLPFFLLLYIKKKQFSGLNFLLLPLTSFVVYIPAWILGKPITELFSAYSEQVVQYKSLVLNFSNIYSLLPDNYEFFMRSGIIITLIVLTGFYVAILSNRITMDCPDYIIVAMITVMMCTYFLPSMHERYMFTADLLAIIYLFIYPNKYYVPLLIWFINTNAYFPFLFGFGPIIDFRIMALIYLGLLIFLVSQFFGLKLRLSTHKAQQG